MTNTFFCQTEGHATHPAVAKIPCTDGAAPGDDFDYYCFDCALRFGHIKAESIGEGMFVARYGQCTTKHGTFAVGDVIRIARGLARVRITHIEQTPSGTMLVSYKDEYGGADTTPASRVRKLDAEIKLRLWSGDDGLRTKPLSETTLPKLIEDNGGEYALGLDVVRDIRALGISESALTGGGARQEVVIERIA